MRDQNATKRTAGQTAAGTAYSAAIDTRAAFGVGDLTGRAKLFLAVPIISGLSDTKTVTFTVQDSADGSTFAAVAAYPAKVYTGASSAGAPAATYYFEWTSALRRYVRVSEVVVSTPGSIVAYNYDFGVELGSQSGV